MNSEDNKRTRLLQAEIKKLEIKARALESWLLEHTDKCETTRWFEIKADYNNIVYNIQSKKEKIQSMKSDRVVPLTVELPRYRG